MYAGSLRSAASCSWASIARSARHVAELHQIADEPVACLQLALGMAGGELEHLFGGGEPLVEVLRAPERRVAGVEGVQERRCPMVARPAHGLVAAGLALAWRGRVVGLDRQPPEQPVVAGAPEQRLLEQGDGLLVDGDDRHPEAAEAERRAGEQLGLVLVAGDLRRRSERRPGVLPGPQAGLAQRQQELASLVSGRPARGPVRTARRLPRRRARASPRGPPRAPRRRRRRPAGDGGRSRPGCSAAARRARRPVGCACAAGGPG